MSDHRLDRIHADDFLTRAILDAECDALNREKRFPFTFCGKCGFEYPDESGCDPCPKCGAGFSTQIFAEGQ